MQFWTSVLRDQWGLDATVSKLDGEYDLNFFAQTTNGDGYVLKAMRPGCEDWLVDMQVQAMDHIAKAETGLPIPKAIAARSGEKFLRLEDESGAERLVWLINRLPGKCYAHVAPKSERLIRSFGNVLGRTTRALQSFTHPKLNRDFKWDLTQAGWIADHLTVIKDTDRHAILSETLTEFKALEAALAALPRQAIHNDANDYNILVAGDPGKTEISGLIDFGDMLAGPRVCDLAISGAYFVLDHPNPEVALSALVSGYHAAYPLTAEEIDMVWALLRVRLAVSVVNSTLMAAEDPDDPYITVSQAPAWRFLEEAGTSAGLMQARLRTACGLPVVDGADRVMDWLSEKRGRFAPLLGRDLTSVPMGSLSVEESTIPQNPFSMQPKEAVLLGQGFGDDNGFWLGYYGEPRLIYTSPSFRKGHWKASDRRTVHLAVDGFAPAGTPVHAPLKGEVVAIENRDAGQDYGGVIVLCHKTSEGDPFYTLYGHLDPECCERLSPGDAIEEGQEFSYLGDPNQNGGWAPHLHFQLALSIDGFGPVWPGVADPDEFDFLEAIFPNPAALLNLPDEKVLFLPTDRGAALKDRRAHFGGNLSLTYDEPLMLLRGWKHHLFDEWGRPYLDAYNNVPHVGHAHPRIQAVAADQLLRMNSNTRYLHPAQTDFARTILSKLPDTLDVCFFMNSGSEANELALRLARAHTGFKGMVTPDHGYFGNSTGTVDISAYKFNKPGGSGQPDWVELVEVADDYRGSFRRDDPDRARKFADLVDPAISALQAKDHGLAGFIAETFPSVGGQFIPPKGYLAAVYQKIRAAGGVCIADEVQTSLGRLGEYYFGVEQQEVVPDIVVMGKPIGNGHPIGVVVTTKQIADSFNNGIEFFSTFGGSTLSCRIGKEVLDIVDDEGLQDNARYMGKRLLDGLKALDAKHDCIGDVRGVGLFVGLELINPGGSEATAICSYVKNRMRDHRILIGSEGPKDNILKIRPPMTIEADDIDMILTCLDQVLSEV